MRSIGVLVVTALVGWTVVGCGDSAAELERKRQAEAEKQRREEAERTRQAILRVLRADQQLARQRENLPPKSTPSQIAWAVGRYCDDLARLDMGDCPAEFRVAYRAHVGAWRETQAALQQLPDGFLSGLMVGAMNSMLRGEKDGGVSRLEGGLKQALDRVRDTWYEVEMTGALYGAAL